MTPNPHTKFEYNRPSRSWDTEARCARAHVQSCSDTGYPTQEYCPVPTHIQRYWSQSWRIVLHGVDGATVRPVDGSQSECDVTAHRAPSPRATRGANRLCYIGRLSIPKLGTTLPGCRSEKIWAPKNQWEWKTWGKMRGGGCGRTEESCSMVKNLYGGKVDFSDPAGHYTYMKSYARAPLEKILGAPLVANVKTSVKRGNSLTYSSHGYQW